MEESIETRVAPKLVWEAWERAYRMHGDGAMVPGLKLKTQKEGAKGFRFEILEVRKGEGFSLEWKTWLVRLVFSHTVVPMGRGSKIVYAFRIKGLFAKPVRFFLKNKIQENLRQVLKSFVRQLELQR